MKNSVFVYANALMLISRLRSFSPAPGGPGAYVFLDLDVDHITEMCVSRSTAVSRSGPSGCIPPCVPGDVPGAVTCVLEVLEG